MTKLQFDYSNQQYNLDLTLMGKTYGAMIGEKSAEIKIIHSEDGKLDLLIDGERVIAYVSSDGAKRWVTVNGRTVVLTKASGAKRSGAGQEHASELAAPMPGVVRSVNIEQGESVKKGQTLLVLEAMKMEIRIQAPFDGLVKSLAVKVGETVEREQILIVLER